ncbi:peroxisome biogenesis factor 10 [Leptinotarsa decemlineata]|uniref:peroxisome biogenesis factor 10 n=1 Tax=Leptinotarsa decemlineata TaxID=7539 RepID=UPI003D3096E0
MTLYKAKVADVLRLSQRDELFVRDLEEQMHSFFKLMGSRSYHHLNKSVPLLANLWYYFMTTLGNLQTLGEEYTGTIRVGNMGKIPSKTAQTLWLILYVGGEPLLERLLNYSRNKINNSVSMTDKAKSVFLSCIDIFKEEKSTIKRIHTSLFYMDGKYYNISNRLTGIHYVLLRDWLQKDSFTGAFYFLGNVSLFYILFSLISKLFLFKNKGDYSENVVHTSVSIKSCVLCAENLQSPCSTPCGHIFCWNCIYDSLSYQKNCPICRETVNPSRIIFLQNFV